MKKGFFILLASIILLAGCNNPISNLTGSNEAKDVAQKGQIYAEKAPSETAMTEKSITCGMLKHQPVAECERTLNEMTANFLQQEITKYYESSRCDELPGSMAQNCKSTIEASGVTGPVTDEEIQIFARASTTILPMPAGANSEGAELEQAPKCGDLKTPGYKELCEKQLNSRVEQEKMFQIMQSGDATKCDELTDEGVKQMCKIQLGVTIQEPVNPVSENLPE